MTADTLPLALEPAPGSPAPELERTQLPPLSDAEAHAQIARIVAHQQRIATIQANAAALIKQEQDALAYLESDPRLREWTLRHLQGRKRSVRVLSGIAGFRTVPARLTVTDELAAITWCRAHDLETALVVRLDPKRLGKPAEWVTEPDPETGEERYLLPDGVEVVPERQQFYVKSGLKSGADTPGEDE